MTQEEIKKRIEELDRKILGDLNELRIGLNSVSSQFDRFAMHMNIFATNIHLTRKNFDEFGNL